MEFDKNKILTCVTGSSELIGKKGWFGNSIPQLMNKQNNYLLPHVLQDFDSSSVYPFVFDDVYRSALFYPAPEPSYRPFTDDELNDLVGKVLTNKYTGYNKLVTEQVANIAVRVGDSDCTAKDLFHYFTLDGKPCGVREEA